MARARRLQSVHDSFCAETHTRLAVLTAISYQGITGIQLEINSSNLGWPTKNRSVLVSAPLANGIPTDGWTDLW
jgi:hypothetical protein